MESKILQHILTTVLIANKANVIFLKSKSNLHYTRRITPKRVTSCGAHLRGLAPGLHSSEEMSQRWRVVGDTVSINRPWSRTPDLPHR